MGAWIYWVFPVFLISIAIEAALVRRAERQGRRDLLGYTAPDTAASLTMGAVNVLIALGVRTLLVGGYFWLYEHRPFELGTGVGAWVALFVAEDFTYYWWHRASHEVRFLWAAHENHHSSQRYNLSTALRQSWTTPFTIPLFYWWLPLVGFHPMMLLAQVSLSLVYQFWIHTELIGRLGWFESAFNTPSHHRVHHGSNLEYLDRNHGGILIVWDRLFGTFEPEGTRVRYGLTTNIDTFNPVRIAFHEWAAMLHQALRPAPLRTRLAYLVAPPGWSPDGSTLTAAQLRERHGAATAAR